MLPDNSKSNELIDKHKTTLLLTGELSDFQLTNLKAWPMILFDGLEQVTINYDFKLDENSEKENALGLCAGIISYDFEFSPNARITKKQKEQKLTQLTFWTRFLFWNDTEVVFKRRGRKWTL